MSTLSILASGVVSGVSRLPVDSSLRRDNRRLPWSAAAPSAPAIVSIRLVSRMSVPCTRPRGMSNSNRFRLIDSIS